MTDIYFFLKTMALTIAIVLVMQIEVGTRTLEGHAMSWVQSSAVVAPLKTVARGASKLVKDSFASVTNSLKSKDEKKKDQR